jgi:hypothetical protein
MKNVKHVCDHVWENKELLYHPRPFLGKNEKLLVKILKDGIRYENFCVLFVKNHQAAKAIENLALDIINHKKGKINLKKTH